MLSQPKDRYSFVWSSLAVASTVRVASDRFSAGTAASLEMVIDAQ